MCRLPFATPKTIFLALPAEVRSKSLFVVIATGD
jgi:hypothetical protein